MSKEWLKRRKQWVKDHPPNHQGFYECYICHKWVLANEVTVDHVIPRSNAKNYANRNDDSNLKPCCYTCNTLKGSKHS